MREKKKREGKETEMNPSSIFILLFCFFGSSSLVNSQTDSCSSRLNLRGLIPFNTTSFRCRPVWDDQDYILRYLQSGPNTWSFVLSAPDTTSYAAIGFSATGRMVGSSAIVGWIPATGAGVIKQYFLGATDPDQVKADQGSLPLVNNSMAIATKSSRLYLAFQLNTSQPPPRLIYSVGPKNRLPSSDFRLSQHRNQISTSFNYVTGQITQRSSYSKLKTTHGVLNMLGWGILMLIGAITARHFKQWDPMWFYAHISIQLCAFLLGFSGIIIGFVLENRLDANDVDKHKGLGIFILALGCLQVMAILVRPKKTSKVRKYWNWYHYYVGRLLVVLATANVFYGIHLGDAGTGWNAGYGVVLALLVLAAIVLEVRMWTRR